MSEYLDRPAAIRAGEEINPVALDSYLAQALPGWEGLDRIEQFPGGHSNLTYLVHGKERVYVLRRPPFGSRVKSAHDMGREFTVLSALNPVYSAAPKPALYCEDESVMGAPFYLMERVEGIILRSKPPKGFSLSESEVRAICHSFLDNLVELHSFDYEALGLTALRRDGQYTERQVTGWIKRYGGSQTDAIPDIDAICDWLADRIPPDTGATLIHNDYKFDNIALDPGNLARIVGVFDWEMATIGDPMMDLGTSLGYWCEEDDENELKAVQCFLSTWPGAWSRRELADAYTERTGRNPQDLLFYYVFALLKLSVIIQQIYYRYQQGLTQDPRFAGMIEMVRGLGRKGCRAIETGRIGR